MEAKSLEDFLLLAETRSFGRSAELRHLPPPALLHRIQSLEALLGAADMTDCTSHPM